MMYAIFSKHKNSITSWLIRKIERSKFSHVAILYQDKITGRWLVAQSNKYRLNIVSLENFEKENAIIAKIEICDSYDKYMSFLRYTFDHLGNQYGYLTMFGILLNRIFKIKNPFADGDKTFFCSEYFIKAIGVKDINPEIDGPKKIYEKLMAC